MAKNKVCSTIFLKMIYNAQCGVAPSYDIKTYSGTCNRVIEKQTSDFLNDYASKNILIKPEDEELLLSIMSVAHRSHYNTLRQSLKSAKIRYQHNKERALIVERAKERLIQSHFSVLDNKKTCKNTSSEDFLMIDNILSNCHEFNTDKLKNKLYSHIQNKITRTLNGKIEPDEDFNLLIEKFGTNQQSKYYTTAFTQKENSTIIINKPSFKARFSAYVSEKMDHFKNLFKRKNKPHKSSQKYCEPITSKPREDEISFVEKLFVPVEKIVKATFVLSGIAALSYCGQKMFHTDTADNTTSLKTTVVTPTNVTTIAANDKDTLKTIPTDFANDSVKTAPTKVTLQDLSDKEIALQKAYKNRFDTSLEILLGQDARDALYQKIDKLAQEGKIKYENGTTREWYAHAFTMYQKITPNSDEYKQIKNLLNGENVDTSYINSLVVKAKRNGTGVKGTGTHSCYDNSSSYLQQKHAESKNNVRVLQQAVLQSQAVANY